MSKTPWIFVDCEARGTSPVHGVLTEFGAVHYDTRDTFHGRLFHGTPDPENPAISIVGARIATDKEVAESFAAWLRGHLGNSRPVFVSDNPAYDWQWIAGMFDRAGMDNPFGHSGRRISDFWAGLNRNWNDTQGWKRLRKTVHDHNPVNDAMGNVEAFEEILRMAKGPDPRLPPATSRAADPWDTGSAVRRGLLPPAGPGPGRGVAHRDGGAGKRDQLQPFLQGRRLPAVLVPICYRAGLLLLAALGDGGLPPDRQGRDLPAPRARARVTVEGVNAPAKTCDICHHPHLPPKLPDGGVPPALAPGQAPCTGTEWGPATPDTTFRPPGAITSRSCIKAAPAPSVLQRWHQAALWGHEEKAMFAHLTGEGPALGPASFRRIVDVPFETCVTALDSWQQAEHGGEVRFGDSLLCGPAEQDPGSATYRIQVRLARGALRPLLRMRMDVDRWSATSTVLELIPAGHVRPTAAYFRAGHLLLDSLIRQLLQPSVPAQVRSTVSQPTAPVSAGRS